MISIEWESHRINVIFIYTNKLIELKWYEKLLNKVITYVNDSELSN